MCYITTCLKCRRKLKVTGNQGAAATTINHTINNVEATGNIVEAIFDFVDATFDFVATNNNNVERFYCEISSFRQSRL